MTVHFVNCTSLKPHHIPRVWYCVAVQRWGVNICESSAGSLTSLADRRFKLDEMFPRPQLLATILFSIHFILFAGTGGTAVVFAKYTLAMAMPDTSISDMDDRLINLVAVFVQTGVCLLLYFGRRLTLFLNKAFSFLKIALLITIFIGSLTAINRRHGLDDFKTVQPGYKRSDCLSAMIYVLFSYQGWENANYVGCAFAYNLLH